MKEKTLKYSFTIKHIEGKDMTAVDTLSRYPVTDPDVDDVKLDEELEIASLMVAAVVSDVISVTIPHLKEHAEKDAEYQELKNKIEKGFGGKRKDETPVGKL